MQREYFAPDEEPCSAATATRILLAYVAYADDARLSRADSAMQAHGVSSAELSATCIANAVRTERRGRSLLASLVQLRGTAC